MGMQNLLRKLQDQPKSVEEHFAETKQEWIADVAKLITTMEEWLAPLVEKKLARLEHRTVELDEPDTGPYSVDALTISLGDREVRVEPRGMRIVGAVRTERAASSARGGAWTSSPDRRAPPSSGAPAARGSSRQRTAGPRTGAPWT